MDSTTIYQGMIPADNGAETRARRGSTPKQGKEKPNTYTCNAEGYTSTEALTNETYFPHLDVYTFQGRVCLQQAVALLRVLPPRRQGGHLTQAQHAVVAVGKQQRSFRIEAEIQVACHVGGLWGKGAQNSCCELIVEV